MECAWAPELIAVRVDGRYTAVKDVQPENILLGRAVIPSGTENALRAVQPSNVYDGKLKPSAAPANSILQSLVQFVKVLNDIDAMLADGRAKEITAWLHDKIHRYGGYREPKEVLMAVCGKEADAKPLINYFKEKYSKLYNIAE